MKIKTDFVTNSSSASYIIAIKKNLTIAEIKEELLKDKESLKRYISEYKDYWADDYEPGDEDNFEYSDYDTARVLYDEEGKPRTPAKQVEALAEQLARSIHDHSKGGLEIGDFLVCACEGSSEDISLFSNWLYSFADINTDVFKIEGTN